MRESGYKLNKKAKGDVDIKVGLGGRGWGEWGGVGGWGGQQRARAGRGRKRQAAPQTSLPRPPRPTRLQVPLLATCQLVQRMVVAERRKMEAALAELAALKKQLAGQQGGAPGGPVAVEP